MMLRCRDDNVRCDIFHGCTRTVGYLVVALSAIRTKKQIRSVLTYTYLP